MRNGEGLTSGRVKIHIEMEGQGITAIYEVVLTKIMEMFWGDRGLVVGEAEEGDVYGTLVSDLGNWIKG